MGRGKLLADRSAGLDRSLPGWPDGCRRDRGGSSLAVDDAVETAPAGKLELKGFARPVAAYEVVGPR